MKPVGICRSCFPAVIVRRSCLGKTHYRPGEAVEDALQTRVTHLLEAVTRGSAEASDELLPLVYGELRILARRWLDRESGPMTLQPTDLVHEAYLRLVGDQNIQWDGRGHFFGAAAMAMRRILVERARRRQRVKHGGALVRQAMLEEPGSVDPSSTDLIALDEALHMLEQKDERMYRMVMLRYFAGLGVEDTASVLDISTRTVKREWRVAKVMLHHWMSDWEGK